MKTNPQQISIVLPKAYAVWIYRYLERVTLLLNPRESQPLFWLQETLRQALQVKQAAALESSDGLKLTPPGSIHD